MLLPNKQTPKSLNSSITKTPSARLCALIGFISIENKPNIYVLGKIGIKINGKNSNQYRN
jgi:hypothetical protein